MWTRMVGANLGRPRLNEGARPATTTSETTVLKEGKKESASVKPTFVYAFVNKDATTIGTRSKEEALMVHSHVAKNALAQVKGRSSNAKPPSETLQDQSLTLEVCQTNPFIEHRPKGSKRAARSEGLEFCLELGRWLGDAEVDVETNPCGPRLSQQTAVRRWIQIQPAVQPPSPLRTLGQGASDPFNAAAFPIDATLHALFKLSQTLWVGYLFPDLDEPRLQRESLNAWSKEMSQTVSNTLAFHSHLTTTLAFVSKHMSHVHFGHKTSILFNMHSSLALHLLRAHLSTGNLDRNTLLLLWKAFLSAFFQGDLRAMKLHFKGLTSASQLLSKGGTLDPMLKDLVIVARLLLATWALEEDNVSEYIDGTEGRLLAEEPPLQMWDGAPTTSTLTETNSLQLDPVVLALIETTPWLSKPLAKHLHRNREAIATMHHLNSLRNSTEEHSAPPPLLRNHLLALTSHTTALHISIVEDFTADPLTRAIRSTFCLAVCYARRLILDCTWFTAGVFVPFAHLQTHLENLLSTMRAELGHLIHEDCLLWMFFIGACAEEILWKSRILNDDDFSKSRWFSTRFFKLTQMMGYTMPREDARDQVAEGFEKYMFDEKLRGLFDGLCKKRTLLEWRVREVEMPPLLV